MLCVAKFRVCKIREGAFVWRWKIANDGKITVSIAKIFPKAWSAPIWSVSLGLMLWQREQQLTHCKLIDTPSRFTSLVAMQKLNYGFMPANMKFDDLNCVLHRTDFLLGMQMATGSPAGPIFHQPRLHRID